MIELKALKAYCLVSVALENLKSGVSGVLRYSSARFSGYLCAMPRVRKQNAIRNANPKLAGFSLVEILVVVMVILIIAAIAIPNLVHGKMRANEAAAVSSIKTINTAQVMYHDAFPEVGYSSSLANLGTHGSSCEKPTSTNACLIMDEALTSGMKSGYIFEIVGDGNTPTTSYTVNATPESGVSGRCNISSSQSGEISLSLPGAPTAGGDKSVGSGSGGCE
jgi:prepilin-type N-terminal cleavage/methylation domain-containing protein